VEGRREVEKGDLKKAKGTKPSDCGSRGRLVERFPKCWDEEPGEGNRENMEGEGRSLRGGFCDVVMGKREHDLPSKCGKVSKRETRPQKLIV